MDGLSSDPALSLPSSSAPQPTPGSRSGTPRRPANALNLDDDDEAAEGVNDANGAAPRRRRRNVEGEVPLVRDVVGESVAGAFETFLKTCV